MLLHLPGRPLRFILRYALLGAALPCAYLIGAALAFCCRERAANAACATLRLPALAAPTPATRLLVFAPHCDDETLGCAGLIQQTLAAGGKAQVVMLTNGDGFHTAVECREHSLRIDSEDFIRFAAQRQEESCGALGNLGLPRDAVRFLGYPDRGLQALWNDCWTPGHPYVSSYTRCASSPYPNTFRPGTTYCGQSLLDDIKTNLRAFRPTLVTVTHPSEDHGDHAAAGSFVTRALQELQNDPQERSWAAHTRLVYYLVHRGDWPAPVAAGAASPLGPPASMAHGDTHWMALPLTSEQVACKTRSIDLYPSQTSMMGRFLHAFARKTELYGELPATRLAVIPDSPTSERGNLQTPFSTLPPVLLDPVRDDILRDMNGGADVRAVYACRNSRNLYVRLDCREDLNPRYVYTLRMRSFGPKGETPARALTLQMRPEDRDTMLPGGICATSHGNSLVAAIPLCILQNADAPLSTLAVSVETELQGIIIDKTGIRFLSCSPPLQSALSASSAPF